MQLSTAFRNEANMTTETPENTTPEGSGHTTDGSGLVALLTQPVCKHCGKPVKKDVFDDWIHFGEYYVCDVDDLSNTLAEAKDVAAEHRCKHCGCPVRRVTSERVPNFPNLVGAWKHYETGRWSCEGTVEAQVADVEETEVSRLQSHYPLKLQLDISLAESEQVRKALVRAFISGAKYAQMHSLPESREGFGAFQRQTIDAFLGTGEELSL
jgi:hypothetical protein